VELKPAKTSRATTAVPPGWNSKPIGQIGPLQRGFDLPNRDIRPGLFPIVYSNGADGFHCKAMAAGPGVVTGRSGTIGRVHFVESAFWPHNTSLWVTRFNGNDPKFVFYLYDFIGLDRFASGSGVPTLNRNDAHSFAVAIPDSPAEQQAIARALTDVDALLAGLDRLIAKKRDLKQAAMQQLLTGQTRLPGFHGEWKVTQLGDVAHIKTGSRNNEDKVMDGEYPFFVRSENVERIDSYSHDCEAILVPGEGRIGSIFHYIKGRFDVHQRVYAITQFRPEVSGRFVHLCMSFKFGAWAMQNSVKATVDSLRLPTFQTFELSLPPTLDEQAAIAGVLSDMDAELTALEARREKTRALKQGMMQELLTGRTRLV
jgi:type I restriction enzyme S subunit